MANLKRRSFYTILKMDVLIHVHYVSVKCTKLHKGFQFHHLKADYYVFRNLLKKIYHKTFFKIATIATTVQVMVWPKSQVFLKRLCNFALYYSSICIYNLVF